MSGLVLYPTGSGKDVLRGKQRSLGPGMLEEPLSSRPMACPALRAPGWGVGFEAHRHALQFGEGAQFCVNLAGPNQAGRKDGWGLTAPGSP